MVLWQFIFDEKISLWCRVKREQASGQGRKVGDAWTKDELEAEH